MEDEFKISTVLGLNLGPSGNQVATPHGRKKKERFLKLLAIDEKNKIKQ